MPDAGNTTIREMTASDLPGVMALEMEIFESPWTEKLFLQELRMPERTIYLVAERGGEVLGYVGAQVLGSEVHITNMAVAAAYRRRGVGSRIFIACARSGAARGARWLTLEVRESNLEAREFYRRFGFEEIGLRKRYYVESGEDAVIMATGDVNEPGYRELMARLEAEHGETDGGP